MTVGGYYCHLHLYKNGESLGIIAYSDSRGGHADHGSMSVVLELTTGDKLWVQSGNCEFLYGDQFISFLGFKL